MNVSLTAELEKFVNERVASGLYTSASEVVREGLRLLQEKELLKQIKLRELRQEVRKGLDQLERDEVTVYESESLSELAAEIKRQGREERASKNG